MVSAAEILHIRNDSRPNVRATPPIGLASWDARVIRSHQDRLRRVGERQGAELFGRKWAVARLNVRFGSKADKPPRAKIRLMRSKRSIDAAIAILL